MAERPPPPPETLAAQARASDPASSAWVSANAGSGKTHVLSRRVIRLLLRDVDPSRILCLTYTKAAAANMATRVFADLGRWATLDAATLAAEIEALERRRPDADHLRRARRLFARALETPGGLKIQTIHAFCEALLHRFPLEANIAGHFEMLDSRMEEALMAEARRDLLSGVAEGHDPDLADGFAAVLETAGEAGLDALLTEIVRKRDGVRGFIDAVAFGERRYQDLFEEFDFGGDDDEAAIIGDAWPDGYFDQALAERLHERALQAGKVKALEFAAALKAACASDGLEAARHLFLRKASGGAWETKSTRQILSKGVAEHFPGFDDAFARAADAVRAAADRLATLRMLRATRSALTLADWLIARYERLKTARGFLDFNDLITRTVRLLSRGDVGPWIQYKLDQGIDHILVDEAQDTSPDQWLVVARLAEEFFSGLGSRERNDRTIFAVGDEKQSIYSFQGAEPEAFDIYRHAFRERVEAAGLRFEPVRLTHSFRSTEDVLQAVDVVFGRDEARKGLTSADDALEHKAVRIGEAGSVELWRQVTPTSVEEPQEWTEAIDHASAPAVRLAELVAETIAGWLRRGETIEGRGRRVRPGDVLVLVRKRDRFIHALSRGLKNRQVPVAGADRLDLTAHIAVQDLMALGRFALQPDDDLSLAALLKSPVFGRSEDDLFALAWDRPAGRSLHQALREAARHDASWAAVAEALAGWRNEAGTRPVFEFYAALLGRDGIRRKMVQRLGQEAADILDEFLAFLLAAEQNGVDGLEAVLALLDGGGPEIKREMDQSRDEVRIMTVHASKGLEAPIVFLVDNGSAPFSESHLPRLMPFRSTKGLWSGDGFVWRASSDVANAASRRVADAIGEKAREEYRRLLYVGMTRAEDRLVVCGYRGVRDPEPGIWHSLVETALVGEGAVDEPHPLDENLSVLRYRVTRPTRPVATPRDEPPRATAIEAPSFLKAPLPPGPSLPRPLSPSGAGALIEDGFERADATASPVLGRRDETSPAALRGTAIHRLLQSLPGMDAGRRADAARRYLERIGSGWPRADREDVRQAVEAILETDAFAPVFAPGSRAEVSVMGTIRLGDSDRAVSGKIDRLAITKSAVLIVDYKTTRPAPRSLAETPQGHVAQLALYRALLKPLYPGREIEAALLYTDAPRLIALAPDILDQALVQLAGA